MKNLNISDRNNETIARFLSKHPELFEKLNL